jgi:hypothetical protein
MLQFWGLVLCVNSPSLSGLSKRGGAERKSVETKTPNSAVTAKQNAKKVCSVHTVNKVLINIFPELYFIVKDSCVSPGYSLTRQASRSIKLLQCPDSDCIAGYWTLHSKWKWKVNNQLQAEENPVSTLTSCGLHGRRFQSPAGPVSSVSTAASRPAVESTKPLSSLWRDRFHQVYIHRGERLNTSLYVALILMGEVLPPSSHVFTARHLIHRDLI